MGSLRLYNFHDHTVSGVKTEMGAENEGSVYTVYFYVQQSSVRFFSFNVFASKDNWR